MDVLMVEQLQMDASFRKPAEKTAVGGSSQSFGRAMDSALASDDGPQPEKAADVARSSPQLSDASDVRAEVYPEEASVSQPVLNEACKTEANEDALQAETGRLNEDEDDREVFILSQYTGGTISPIQLTQTVERPLVPAVSVDKSGIACVEPMLSGALAIETGGDLQYKDVPVQGGAIAGIPVLAPAIMSDEDLSIEGSDLNLSEPVAGNLALPEGIKEQSLKAAHEGSQVSPDTADDGSFTVNAGLTADMQADGLVHGLSSESDVEVVSSDLDTGDAGMADDSTAGVADNVSGSLYERDGFGQSGGGNDGNRDMQFSAGPHAAVLAEPLSSSGFSAEMTEAVHSVAAPESALVETEVLQRFGEGVRLSLSDGMKDVRINMHPEELGGVTIKLRVDNGTVNAHVLVDSQSVKGIFDADTGRLRDIFAQNGLVLDRFSVELGGGHGSSGGYQGTRQEQHGVEPVSPVRLAYHDGAVSDSLRGVQSFTASGRSAGGIDLFA